MSFSTAFTHLPEPPYYAVIFSSVRTAGDNGYAETAQRLLEQAARVPGFLGAESARGDDGFGITVSYWASEAAIRQWKADEAHRAAQTAGQQTWYEHYEIRVARVERAYGQSENGKPPV